MIPSSISGTRSFVLDSLLILLLTAALIWPLFKVNYTDKWDSIESTFISDARFLRDHWPHPRWQPLWYCGTRFDYIYPPALRYGTAVLTKLYPPLLPVRAYHIYTAFFYCLGIAGVYLFVRIASGSRGAAWLAAAAAALLSPAFLFMKVYRLDAGHLLVPQRLGVLARYGEGPHMTAFAWIPIALAAAFHGLQKGRLRALALAAIFSALVVSNNFYGATALAVLLPLLVWSLWVTARDHRIWFRAAVLAALAYGLTAFWMVPSYFRVTARNLQFVAEPGNTWSPWVALAVAALFAAVTYKLGQDRPGRAYPIFVCGALLFFATNVLGNYFFRFRVAGEPTRLIPELDLVLILAAVEALRQLWRRRWWVSRACLVAIVLVSFSTSRRYVRHAWSIYTRDPNVENRLERRITDWMADNLPQARTIATGSVRFWYTAWHDLAQIGGGSEQGLLNPAVMPAQWQILLGDNAELAIQWMLCLGIDAAIVHDEKSKEAHHDFQFPRKFAEVLPVLYDDGEGNLIYHLPRRFASLGRVVEKARAESLRPVQTDFDLENLRAYASVVERGPDSPVKTAWQGTDSLLLQATVNPGELILVQVSYDPAWRAYSAGRSLPIRKDVLGQMLIEAPPGAHYLQLVFERPLENVVGTIASVISAGVVLVLIVRGRWGKRLQGEAV